MGKLNKAVFFAVVVCGLFFAGVTSGGIQDGLISYWPLDEGAASTAEDIMGGHNGTLAGGASWVDGKIGKAIDTNNSGYVVIPEHVDLRPSAVSVQMWASVDSFGNWEGLAGNFQDNGSNESGYCFYTTDSSVAWYVSDGTFKTIVAPSVPTSQWVHFVGTYDGSYIRMYMNGQEVSGSPLSVNGNINWSYIPLDMNIGRYHDDNENFASDARIDEVAVWDRAIIADEVAFLYNGGQGNSVLGGAYVVVTETDGGTSVEEGGAFDSYTLSLSEQPSADVTITATPGDSQIDLGNGPGVAVDVVFTAGAGGDWETPKTITITAFDDDIYEGKISHATIITHAATGGEYQGISISSVTVDVFDNEETCGDWGYYVTDLNKDCYVNLLDFAIFASYWVGSGN